MKKLNVKGKKQGGFVLTAELVLIVTILVLGSIVGMVTMRDALNAEMEDVAEAVGVLDQGYDYRGIENLQQTAATAGSAFTDMADFNAGDTRGFVFTVALDGESTTGSQGVPSDAALTAVSGSNAQ